LGAGRFFNHLNAVLSANTIPPIENEALLITTASLARAIAHSKVDILLAAVAPNVELRAAHDVDGLAEHIIDAIVLGNDS